MEASIAAPLYQSHEKVRALKIKSIEPLAQSSVTGGHLLHFEESAACVPALVSFQWLNFYSPYSGGYYVAGEYGQGRFVHEHEFRRDYIGVGRDRTKIPCHPGETLSEFMEGKGWTASELARRLGVPANRVTLIVSGQRSITADTALRLERLDGPSARFWMTLQMQWDLAKAEGEGE